MITVFEFIKELFDKVPFDRFPLFGSECSRLGFLERWFKTCITNTSIHIECAIWWEARNGGRSVWKALWSRSSGDTDSLFIHGLGEHVFSLIIGIQLTEVLVWDQRRYCICYSSIYIAGLCQPAQIGTIPAAFSFCCSLWIIFQNLNQVLHIAKFPDFLASTRLSTLIVLLQTSSWWKLLALDYVVRLSLKSGVAFQTCHLYGCSKLALFFSLQ